MKYKYAVVNQITGSQIARFVTRKEAKQFMADKRLDDGVYWIEKI